MNHESIVSVFYELKSTVKSVTPVNLRLSSDMISTAENNFLHKLLLTDRQVVSLCKTLANTQVIHQRL